MSSLNHVFCIYYIEFNQRWSWTTYSHFTTKLYLPSCLCQWSIISYIKDKLWAVWKGNHTVCLS